MEKNIKNILETKVKGGSFSETGCAGGEEKKSTATLRKF